jgi:ferric-dicitrate binding protein FerR (iron transport regulator)
MERNREIEELRSDKAFAELLSKAPPRPVPPAADEAQIRQMVHAEWRKVAGGHVRRRRVISFALAASVLLAVFATLNLTRDPAGNIADMQLAAVEKQFGEISINSQPAHAGQLASIEGGDVVETGSASGLALGWHDGGSLRIDRNTVVVFEAANQVYLRNGRVYFDSLTGALWSRTAIDGAANLAIRTDHGVVRHLGTQFMTQAGEDELVVSVREGVVSIDGSVTARASAGQQFAISASGTLSIKDTNGVDDWEWVEKSTPAVNLNGRFVAEALEWVSRESGRTISYTSEDAERIARETQLRGNMQLPPSRALEVFIMTVDLNARIEGEVIVISED